MFLVDDKSSSLDVSKTSQNDSRSDASKAATTTTQAMNGQMTSLKSVENSKTIYSGKYSVESIVNGGTKKRKMPESELSDKNLFDDEKSSNSKRPKPSADSYHMLEDGAKKRLFLTLYKIHN